MQHYPYTFDEERVKGWIERNMRRYKEDAFGYHIRKDCQHRGYAKEAASAAITKQMHKKRYCNYLINDILYRLVNTKGTR